MTISNKVIDLRSDALTIPTREMLAAMSHATFLDHILDRDPTVLTLQNKMCELMGKEDAILVPSGTMGNLIAIMAQTNPGESVILEEKSHINDCEHGGIARLAGIQTRQIIGVNGYIEPIEIERNIRIDETEFASKTTLLCLENPHNLAGGIVLTPQQINSNCDVANRYGLKVHLDGARLFNCVASLHCDIKEFTINVDSVMVSLSKGISAPIGSILAGSKNFISKAKKYKKMLGGGMRQEGILAAAGIVGLKSMMKWLEQDNKNAKLLAEGLKGIDNVEIDFSRNRANIVFFKLLSNDYNHIQFVKKLEDYNIKALHLGQNQIRMVTHRGINKQDIVFILDVMRRILNK